MLRYISTILLFTGLLFSVFTSNAQDSAKVKWNTTAQKIAEGRYEIQLTAILSSGWHLDADNPELEITGVTGSIDAVSVKLGNMLPQRNAQSIQDAVFEVVLPAFTDTVTFTQSLEIEGEVPGSIKLNLSYFVGKA